MADESYSGGLTPQEEAVMDHLVDAWNEFVSLPGTTTEERLQFMRGIHAAQNVIALRLLSRLFPGYWVRDR